MRVLEANEIGFSVPSGNTCENTSPIPTDNASKSNFTNIVLGHSVLGLLQTLVLPLAFGMPFLLQIPNSMVLPSVAVN